MSFDLLAPGWLALLAVLPAVAVLGWRNLTALGRPRRALAVVLRCGLIAALALALAEPRLRRPTDHVTVLFVIDRSLSVPPDSDGAGPDRRWERVKRLVREAAARRGPAHANDQTGVILFGRRPRLVLPPSPERRLEVRDEYAAGLDPAATDIAAALKQALASFPEGSGRRVVLVSDGNENRGQAEAQARVAVANGVQIDSLPLAAGFRNTEDVTVEAVEAPPRADEGGRVPVQVFVRNPSPTRWVEGLLELRQSWEGQSRAVAVEVRPGVLDPGPPPQPARVRLRPGLNRFTFAHALPPGGRSFTYEADFRPLATTDEAGDDRRAGVPGDRDPNNRAAAHVIARGRRRVLLIEPDPDPEGPPERHELLRDVLRDPGGFVVAVQTPAGLPNGRAELALYLSNFDCVVVVNVPADHFTDAQREAIRANTGDMGGGLVMVGGRRAFGAGGYQGTAVEKALPVDCTIRGPEEAGKGGLVLVMHASEMAEGNRWQKEMAKLAVRKLAPHDMVGVLYFDFVVRWHVPFQPVGEKNDRLLAQIERMTPGDLPDFDPALQLAHDELTDPAHALATRHVIIISDGDPVLGPAGTAALGRMRAARVTCTTVGVATHGPAEDKRLERIANVTDGRYHPVTDPSRLPAIYTREARRVSRSFVLDQPFPPAVRVSGGPLEGLDALPTLYGLVRTTSKAAPSVRVAVEGPASGERNLPVLAYWNYGLGRSVAFTSDTSAVSEGAAVRGWDRDWPASPVYARFWAQVVGWAARGAESGRLAATAAVRDGVGVVTVDARDEAGEPLADLRLAGVVSPPGAEGRGVDLKFVQTNAGRYEATFPADDPGPYFVNAQALRARREGDRVVEESVDGVRVGLTVPSSPEFADLESHPALLRRLSELTGGRVYAEDDAELERLAASGELYRPAPEVGGGMRAVWQWLVLAAGLGLLIDVAVRRVAVGREQLAAALRWLLRRRQGAGGEGEGPTYMDRLRSRKAAVGATLERPAPRVEAPGPVASPPAPAPPPETEGDYAERLLRAKKRALKKRGEPPAEPGP